MKFLVAMRLGGEERDMFYVRSGANGDFYALLLNYSSRGLVSYMSYHASGERHLTIRGTGIETRRISPVMLQPTSSFHGAEVLLQAPVLWGGFGKLRPLRKSGRNVLLLDGDSAGFRDDFFIARAFLVEPDKESEIPTPTNVGPRVSDIEKSVTPWVVVEAFQEKLPD